MSRVGKKPIPVPSGVKASISGTTVTIQGPRGELARILHQDMGLQITAEEILVVPLRMKKKTSALWGLTRSLIANMVSGVVSGFQKKLEFEGVGYRATVEGGALAMRLGFTHPVRVEAPEGITFLVEKNTITVNGIDKERVGAVAARIRSLKPPEPYKGKGIHYAGEVFQRKAGKKATASA